MLNTFVYTEIIKVSLNCFLTILLDEFVNMTTLTFYEAKNEAICCSAKLFFCQNVSVAILYL